MNINIDLGNIWEMLSSIGTISAVIISLVLAFKESKSNISVSVATDVYFNRYYTIVLAKRPLDIFTIVEIGYYNRLKKESIDFSIDGAEILDEQGKQISHSDLPFGFVKHSIIKIRIPDKFTEEHRDKKVRFYVKDIEGRIFRSSKIFINKLDKK